MKADKRANEILNASRQLDAFEYAGDIMRPPYEPKDLISLIERNDTLKQNIEAFAVNVANFGHGIKYQNEFDYNKAEEKIKEEANKEWEILRKLYKYLNPLSDFSSLIYKVAVDMYSFGWGMLEVIRNGAGDVCTLEYCRGCNFRLAHNKKAETKIEVWEETEKGYEQVGTSVRFKKFVQIVNGKRIYFKEFGDPRPMSYKTGEYSENLQEGDLANEVAYFCVHSSYTDYGVPYWINTSITASGNVLSELLNYKYFHEGRILPMAVTISGGQLTEGSIKAISDGKGIENAYKILVLEASPFESNEEEKLLQTGSTPRVNIDIKSLTDTNNSDALFRDYQKEGKEKIRDSFRLPPIYTGASADYNRATADTARQISEEQSFVPERKRICDTFNKIINNEKGIKYCELYLKGPDLSNIDQKANILSTLNTAGAITPNMLVPIVEEVLGKDVEAWDEELGNQPFELTKLRNQNTDMYPPDGIQHGIEKSDDDIIGELSRLTHAIRKEIGGSLNE